MNKTDDIEWAIGQALLDGPLTLADMERRLPPELQDDRRWIGVAVYRMLGDGRIRAVGCDHNSHEGDCLVESGR